MTDLKKGLNLLKISGR